MEYALNFWGVRGSFPGTNSKVAQHTSCVELTMGAGHSVFFDAGTGLFAATQKREFKKLSLCLSHFHWDHIQGFPFLNGLYEKDSFEIEIISGFRDTMDRLQVLFDERFYPVAGDFMRSRVKFKFMEVGQTLSLAPDIQLKLAPLNHPGTSFAFRLQGPTSSFVYGTDSDYAPVTLEAEKLLQQADVAVMDSQFLVGDSLAKAHYGHSSFKHTIDVAARLRVRDCILFHFDPSYTDEEIFLMEAQAQNYVRSTYGQEGPQVSMAREDRGIKISL